MTGSGTVSSSDLSGWTRGLAMLLGAGVPLGVSLETLANAEPSPRLAEASAVLLSEVVDRGRTLSEAMACLGDVFDERYVALVRAGEVGGILDETLALIVDLADRERDIDARVKLLRSVRHVEGRDVPAETADARAAERTGAAALFCEVLGMLLGSGVPLPMSLATSAALLPAEEREHVAELASGLDAKDAPRTALGAWFGDWAFIAPVVRTVLAVGARTGTLDHAAAKAAEYLFGMRAALALEGPEAA